MSSISCLWDPSSLLFNRYCGALSPWIKLPGAWVWPFTCVSVDVEHARSIGSLPCAGAPSTSQTNYSRQTFFHEAYRHIHAVVRTDSDWGVCSWPWQGFCARAADRPLFVTSNRCISENIRLRWSAVVFCACERIHLLSYCSVWLELCI